MGLFSGFLTTVVNGIENAGNSVINRAERAVNTFDNTTQKIGGAIDNIGHNVKDISRNGLQRNHIDDIHESKQVIEKNLPEFIFAPKPIKTVSKVIDTAHNVTKVVDKVQSYR